MFFGLLEAEGSSPATFHAMFGNAFAAKFDVDGDFLCSTKTFGLDPQPGKAKQCFCDDVGHEAREVVETELAFWAEQRTVTTIRTESLEQSRVTSETTSTTTIITEETQRRILEEEKRFAEESELRLKKQEEERKRIQEEIAAKDKVQHEAELALDADAHKEE